MAVQLNTDRDLLRHLKAPDVPPSGLGGRNLVTDPAFLAQLNALDQSAAKPKAPADDPWAPYVKAAASAPPVDPWAPYIRAVTPGASSRSFDDLIPPQGSAAKAHLTFDDLMPQRAAPPPSTSTLSFDDLIPAKGRVSFQFDISFTTISSICIITIFSIYPS